jgi:hypothetical protein
MRNWQTVRTDDLLDVLRFDVYRFISPITPLGALLPTTAGRLRGQEQLSVPDQNSRYHAAAPDRQVGSTMMAVIVVSRSVWR